MVTADDGAAYGLGRGYARHQYSLAPRSRRLRPAVGGVDARQADQVIAFTHQAGEAAGAAAQDSRDTLGADVAAMVHE